MSAVCVALNAPRALAATVPALSRASLARVAADLDVAESQVREEASFDLSKTEERDLPPFRLPSS